MLLIHLKICNQAKFIANGWQVDCGSTEEMCRVVTYYLKGAGMHSDRFVADAMIALIALGQSNT